MDSAGDVATTQTLSAAEVAGQEIAEQLGAASAADLRALTVEQLMAPQLPRAKGSWDLDMLPVEASIGLSVFDGSYPVVDGYVLPRAPADVYAEGGTIDVPMITGSVANELTGVPFISSLTTYIAEIRNHYGEFADDILRLYPASSDDEARRASGRMLSERMFVWAGWRSASLHSRQSSSANYYYRFHRRPPIPHDAQIIEGCDAGAFHASEVPYVLGTFAARAWPWQDEDRRLGELMNSYWMNFARTGDPNGAGLPIWPEFDNTQASTMIFDGESRVADIPDRDRLDLWDRFYAKWRGGDTFARGSKNV